MAIQIKKSTTEYRQELCDQLVDHLSHGYSLDCFPPISRNTIKKYLREFPQDFPPERIERAIREGQKWDESVGIAASGGPAPDGFNPSNFNVTAWIFRMKNKYGWGVGGGTIPGLGDGPGKSESVIEIRVVEKQKSDGDAQKKRASCGSKKKPSTTRKKPER